MSYAASVCKSSSFIILAGGALVTSAAWLFAAENVAQPATPELLVKQALQSELSGDGDRQQLLDQAQQLDPNYAPARWHSGQVRYNEKWSAAADVPNLAKTDAALNEYLNIRGKYPQTATGQFELANWCAKKGLSVAERTHLETVIQLNPDHAAARARLGYHHVGDQWLADDEWRQAKGRSAALKKWLPKIKEIRNGLAQSDESRKAAAAGKLTSITDPEAIPALETVAAEDDEEVGQLVVAAFGKMNDPQAALALARMAVFSPSDRVQNDAIEQLRKKPLEAFVPQMLAVLYTPAEVQTEIYFASDRQMVFRQTFVREGQDAKEVLVLETTYNRTVPPNKDNLKKSRGALRQAMRESTKLGNTRSRELQEQNEATLDLNDRITAVLAALTNRSTSDSPQEWWSWWNGLNEYYASEKPVVQSGESESFSLKSCFAPGTKVTTLLGPKPIEQIKIGDQVLSQDPDTGELAYKPVLLTTIRPATELFALDINGERIQATGGHLFWVAGIGWMKARDLKPNYELHTTKGAVQLGAVASGSTEPAYNLVVADFHTYFVGDHEVLSHDNTLRQPTKAIVPGLAAAR